MLVNFGLLPGLKTDATVDGSKIAALQALAQTVQLATIKSHSIDFVPSL